MLGQLLRASGRAGEGEREGRREGKGENHCQAVVVGEVESGISVVHRVGHVGIPHASIRAHVPCVYLLPGPDAHALLDTSFGFRVSGFGFRVCGLGFRVWGLGHVLSYRGMASS